MKFWFMVYDFYPSNTAIKSTFITIMIHSNIATLWFWNTVHDVYSRQSTWGRDAMETISALLVHCDGTAFTTDQQCSFDFILVVDLKKVLTRQSSFRWLERPKRPCMWHHSNEVLDREEQELHSGIRNTDAKRHDTTKHLQKDIFILGFDTCMVNLIKQPLRSNGISILTTLLTLPVRYHPILVKSVQLKSVALTLLHGGVPVL